jgi:hypothetical protein
VDELDDVLRAAERADETALSHVPTRAALDRARDAVLRRRRRRAVQRGGLGVAGVAAVAAVALVVGQGDFTLHRTPAHVSPSVSVTAPAPSPTSTPSSTPTPAPTSTPATAAAAAGLLHVDGLPDHRPLTPEVLATVGEGWVFSTHMLPNTNGEIAVLIASPAGDVYRVPYALGAYPGSLARWLPGSQEVVLSYAGSGRMVFDLRTGAVRADQRGLPPGAEYVGIGSDGNELWRSMDGLYRVPGQGQAVRVVGGDFTYDAGWLDPSGRLFVSRTGPFVDAANPTLVVYDVETGDSRTVPALPSGAQACELVGWQSPTTVLESCGAWVQEELWIRATSIAEVPAGGSGATIVHQYAAGEPRLARVTAPTGSAGAPALVGTARDATGDSTTCDSGAYAWNAQWRSTRLSSHPFEEPVGEVVKTQLVGHRLYVNDTGSCAGEPMPRPVMVHDLASGAASVVLPAAADVDAGSYGLVDWIAAG